jgi:hypothetical protein
MAIFANNDHIIAAFAGGEQAKNLLYATEKRACGRRQMAKIPRYG